MKKIYYDWDEWWDFFPTEDGYNETKAIEIPDELWKSYELAEKTFISIKSHIKTLFPEKVRDEI